jgi:GTP cyclohydrolase I
VVNLADSIGEINYAIEQIPESSDSKNRDLKSLFKELTQAIENETELDDEEKADAVNKVKTIVQASQNKDDEGLQKKATRAVSLLETLAKGLEPASKLAKACGKILPKIIAFLGF